MLSSRQARTLVFVIALLVLSVGASAVAQQATLVRDADAVCATCHQKITASYLATPMANASGLASERLHVGAYQQARSGVTYAISTENGKPVLTYTLPGRSDRVQEPLTYFLGSGHLGLTYLYSRNGYLFESPIAWYSGLAAYAMKPGFENAPAVPALPLNPSCLRCHMSAVEKQQLGTENLYAGLAFQHAGITCEACHGDTRNHVATRGRAAVVNPIKLAPEQRDSTCTVCHLEGDTNVERRGRSVLDYKPGEKISDYLTYYIYAGENTTTRAVSEIEQFQSSRCRIASGPTMSCMNCHDPHTSPAPSQQAAYYRAKCLTCHTQPAIAIEHHPENPDCTSCHMPRTSAQNIAHVAWTDHRIRRVPEEPTQPAPALQTPGAHELVPALAEAPGTPRDVALAYYNLVVAKGVAGDKDRAAKLLAQAAASNPDDTAVMRAAGVIAEMQQKDTEAATYYRKLLTREPENLTAATNLGTLEAKSGDLAGAVKLWRGAFARNADIPELGQNLARAECLLGEKDSAEQTLATVLIYNPALMSVQRGLLALKSGAQSCATKANASY